MLDNLQYLPAKEATILKNEITTAQSGESAVAFQNICLPIEPICCTDATVIATDNSEK